MVKINHKCCDPHKPKTSVRGISCRARPQSEVAKWPSPDAYIVAFNFEWFNCQPLETIQTPRFKLYHKTSGASRVEYPCKGKGSAS